MIRRIGTHRDRADVDSEPWQSILSSVHCSVKWWRAGHIDKAYPYVPISLFDFESPIAAERESDNPIPGCLQCPSARRQTQSKAKSQAGI